MTRGTPAGPAVRAPLPNRRRLRSVPRMPFRSLRLLAALALAAAVTSVACDSDDEDSGGDTAGGSDSAATETSAGTAGGEACWEAADASVVRDPAQNILTTWGSACTSNADCIAVTGDPAAICDQVAAEIYSLPGGYCTKECDVEEGGPNTVGITEIGDPDCAADGSLNCVGLPGVYQRCLKPCDGDIQCGREGYVCRQLPLVGTPEEPKGCLMYDCCGDSADAC